MVKSFSVSRRGHSSLQSAGTVFLVVAGLAIGGCSADVTRFDSSNFNFNDSPETGSTAPRPLAPMRSGSLNDNDPPPPVASSDPGGRYGGGASSVQVASLPDANAPGQPMSDRPASTPGYQGQGYQAQGYSAPSSYPPKPFDRLRHPATGAQAAAVHAHAATPPAKGEMITVQPGDTLYRLS